MSKSSEILKPFREARALLEDRIPAGIESGRKGSLAVGVFRADGRPVAGCKVRLRQRRLDFRIGSNLFMLGGFGSEELNRLFEERFAGLFDLATIPFYWATFEPEEGKPRYARDSIPIYRRPPAEPCVEFCEKHGIEAKAHCLNYGDFVPYWALGSIDREKACLVKRFRELSERYGARIPSWEVTNETFVRYRSQQSIFYDAPDFFDWSYRTADRFFPSNRLVSNEGTPHVWGPDYFRGQASPYYLKLEKALRNGGRVDTIGMQYHMFYREEVAAEETRVYYDPERLYDVMDVYAKLDRELQITEMTVPAYHWEQEDEELQAEIIRILFHIWFSHPAMSGAIYWNLVDGYAYVPSGDAHDGLRYAPRCDPHDMSIGENYYHGGLLRRDLTPKPAYGVLRELVTRTWRSDADAETEASGLAAARLFHGLYDLEIVSPEGKVVRQPLHFSREGHRRFDFVL